MKNAFLVFAGFLFLFSCEKDTSLGPPDDTGEEVEDTSSSLAYFPTDLGSYWIYDNDDTAEIAAAYVETQHYDTYTPEWWTPPSEVPNSQTVWSPQYSNPHFMSGLFRDYTFYPDDYIGLPYKIYSDSDDDWISRQLSQVDDVHMVMVRDSNMTFLGEAMEVTVVRTAEESDLMDSSYTDNPDFWGTYRYFAKDVGLIRTTYRSFPDSTECTIDLVEYLIND